MDRLERIRGFEDPRESALRLALLCQQRFLSGTRPTWGTLLAEQWHPAEKPEPVPDEQKGEYERAGATCLDRVGRSDSIAD